MKEQVSNLTISSHMMMATIASYCVKIDIHVTNVLVHKKLLQPFHLQQTLEGWIVYYHQNDNIYKCFKFLTFVTQALPFISSCCKLLMPYSKCKLDEKFKTKA